jgi:hypothetical protein
MIVFFDHPAIPLELQITTGKRHRKMLVFKRDANNEKPQSAQRNHENAFQSEGRIHSTTRLKIIFYLYAFWLYLDGEKKRYGL